MQQCAMQFDQLQHFQKDQYSQHQSKQKMQFDFLMNQKFDAGLQLQSLLEAPKVEFRYEEARRT